MQDNATIKLSLESLLEHGTGTALQRTAEEESIGILKCYAEGSCLLSRPGLLLLLFSLILIESFEIVPDGFQGAHKKFSTSMQPSVRRG